MPSDQDQIFATSEGNNWFDRNREALEGFNLEADLPLQLLGLYGLCPKKALEVGAANGYRLAAISERHDARVVAVEPSVDAIRDGKRRFPRVEFIQGLAHTIPLQELFDLIIVNFVFHWIDRSNLLRSVSEIDRLLSNKGFLIIGDFYPSNQMRVPYHHLPGERVYTYKQDYAGTFLASGLYRPVSLLTGDHASTAWMVDTPEDERIGIWLLQKVVEELYVDISRPR
jgi:SAM-dependent methyltransferase